MHRTQNFNFYTGVNKIITIRKLSTATVFETEIVRRHSYKLTVKKKIYDRMTDLKMY